MDSMDVNKGVAAILVAGIAFFVTGLLGDNFVFNTEPSKPPIDIPVQEAAPGGAPAPAALPPIAPLLASANVDKGKQFVSQVCAACHTFDKGGHPIVGPNLYGIVGAPHDHEAGFSYSPAMQKFKGQPWTYDALNKWLDDPQTYAPGTRMTYTGIKNNQTRADVIDYLRTLSDNPEPLPKVEAAAPSQAAAPAAGNQGAPAGPATPGAQQQNAAPPAGGTQSGSASGPPALGPFLEKANIQEGDTLAHQICAACHSLNKGGPAIVGPNLFGIVGNVHAHMAGFNYSPAMQKFKGQTWTPAALNQWLFDPQAYAPGTLMVFPGLKNDQQRADVIAYLNTLSDHPEQLSGSSAKP